MFHTNVHGAGWLDELGKLDYLTTHTGPSPIRRGFAPGFVNYKKGALDSQPQVIKLTSCLPMVGGSLRVGTPASSTTKTGRHDIAEILLKVALMHKRSNQIHTCVSYYFLFLIFIYFIAWYLVINTNFPHNKFDMWLLESSLDTTYTFITDSWSVNFLIFSFLFITFDS